MLVRSMSQTGTNSCCAADDGVVWTITAGTLTAASRYGKLPRLRPMH
jgi:hypothetical protein